MEEPDPQPEPEPGPTRRCGDTSGPAVGCAVYDGLCFGDWGFSVSMSLAGDCKTQPLPGSLVTADFAATSGAAAIVNNTRLEVSARDGDRVIALSMPAAIGTFGCDAVSIGAFGAGDYRSWKQGATLDCTVTVTSLDRAQGTFSGTLFEWTGATTITIAGSFDLQRVPY